MKCDSDRGVNDENTLFSSKDFHPKLWNGSADDNEH